MTDSIAATINALIQAQSGCLIVARHDKEIVYQKNCGYADYVKKTPVDKDTQFLVGSVTKQFAAVAILKALYESKKNNITEIQDALDKTIADYLPAEHAIWQGVMPAWAQSVTIHQLLVHSSGIPNYTSLPDYEKQRFATSGDLVAFFKNHALEFTPGEKFAYSNSGYYLLGVIVEAITQQQLDAYLENTFFKPLGMNSTVFPTHGTVPELITADDRFAHLARGYAYEITDPNASLIEVKRYEPMGSPGAAGSLIATGEDLLTWNQALYAGNIIPDFLLKLMLKPQLVTERAEAFYGYGIEIFNSGTIGKFYSHRGGIPGYRSILTFIPKLQLSIVTLQNIVGDPEKVMPEVQEIQTRLLQTLSREDCIKELVTIIETKYPSIVTNRNKYEFSPIYDELIKHYITHQRR